jgi:virginiamycin B lyase
MDKTKRNFWVVLIGIVCFGLATWLSIVSSGIVIAASEGSVTGTVIDDSGKPLRGAPVTAKLDNMSVSRYTDASGKYEITGLKPGSYKISATAYGYESRTIDKDIPTTGAVVGFSLKPKWDATQISTAEYMSAFGNDKDVRNIEANCVICHNFSWIVRRRGMNAEQWKEFMPSMGTSFMIPKLSPEKLDAVTASLAKIFGPDSPIPTKESVQHVTVSDEALHATFRNFTPPTRNFTHSLNIASDGKVYFTELDYKSNKIGVFDLATEQFREYDIPTPRAVPHNPWVARNGQIWATELMGRKLLEIDPETGKLTEYPVPEKAGVHTLREDAQGNIWTSGNVTRFNPSTQKFTVFGTPTTYDLAVDGHDDVWGATGGDNSGHQPGLFKVDSRTADIKVYPVLDMASVRGIEVDAQQNIWFGDATNHRLGKLDQRTGKMSYYKPPTSNFGPYGITINKKTGILWVADFNGASIDRFDPTTGKFVEYPFPSRTQMDRFFAIDAHGGVWFTDFTDGRIGVLETDDMKISVQQ